ncbi:MAG: hypothetical protein LBR83_10805 [Clostridiales bacterium]|jgi:flagellar M-ring protein FliF|nr:hypothetical protein [Clostridiales bacterium]
MPEQLQKVIQPARAWWSALERGQKIRLIAAIGVVLAALILTVYFATRVRYRGFINNIEARDVPAIEAALANAGIRYREADTGFGFDVAADDFQAAHVAVESDPTTNKLPFTYENALSLSGMSTTETQKRELDRLSKQSEIEQYFMMLDGMKDVSVELSIPERVGYIESEQNPSSAAVIVDTEFPYSNATGEMMARHVTHAVDGLLIENVVVTDTNHNTLYSGPDVANGGSAATIIDKQRQEKEKIATDIRIFLMPLFDGVQVMSNLEYPNLLNETTERTRYSPPIEGSETGMPRTELIDQSEAEGMTPQEEPGLGANDQAAPDYQTGNNVQSSASTSRRETDYAMNEEHTVITSAPPSYLRDTSSASVNAVRHILYSQSIWMAEDAARTDADWERFKLNTTRRIVPNDPDLETYIALVTKATGFLPENVTFTISEVPLFTDMIEEPLQIEQFIMFGILGLLILMLLLGMIRRKKQDEEEEEPEPELSVEDLLVSTQLEEAREEAERLEEIDYSKESEVKKQIEKFVTEKPESVAALLRNWLNNEEW